MREFHKDNKINFIDQNDVLVGFDNQGGCCERFGYYYARNIADLTKLRDQIRTRVNKHEGYWSSSMGFEDASVDLEVYSFDPGFFLHDSADYNGDSFDLAIFKLIDGQHNQLYLVLFNSQNGYYSHGFEFSNQGKITQQGTL